MQTDCKQSLNAALPDVVQEYTTFISALYGYPQCMNMTTESIVGYSKDVLTVCSEGVITFSNPLPSFVEKVR